GASAEYDRSAAGSRTSARLRRRPHSWRRPSPHAQAFAAAALVAVFTASTRQVSHPWAISVPAPSHTRASDVAMLFPAWRSVPAEGRATVVAKPGGKLVSAGV